MSYLIQEISIYLFAAFLLGAVYGWIIRGVRAKQDTDTDLRRYDREIEQLRKDNQELRDRVEQLELIPASGVGQDWQDEYPLNVISDIESSTLKKLASKQIETSKELWKYCDSDDAVLSLATEIGVEDFAIQRWVSIAHLLRVANIEAADAELLEATEIYSLPDLAAQKPVRLGEKLAKNNTREKILEVLPSQEKLQGWIEHAQHIVDLEK